MVRFVLSMSTHRTTNSSQIQMASKTMYQQAYTHRPHNMCAARLHINRGARRNNNSIEISINKSFKWMYKLRCFYKWLFVLFVRFSFRFVSLEDLSSSCAHFARCSWFYWVGCGVNIGFKTNRTMNTSNRNRHFHKMAFSVCAPLCQIATLHLNRNQLFTVTRYATFVV